jgi:GH25 family lysozyme M1 (1,4-beta-N-acetylmuramidase)
MEGTMLRLFFAALSFTFLLNSEIRAQDLSRVMVDLAASNTGIVVDKELLNRTNGLELVMVELTLGKVDGPRDINPDFERRVAEVQKVPGLKFGAYHLLTPSSRGADQARGFVDNLQKRCIDGEKVLLAVDWEPICFVRKSKESPCEKKGTTQPSYLRDFVQETTRITGKTPVVFTGGDVLDAFRVAIKTDKDIKNVITNTPLWLAQYYSNYKRTNARGELIPGEKIRTGYIFPSKDTFDPWSDWLFWQYAGGVAENPTSRITTTLQNQAADLSFFNGTREEFRRFFLSHAWTCKSAE